MLASEVMMSSMLFWIPFTAGPVAPAMEDACITSERGRRPNVQVA